MAIKVNIEVAYATREVQSIIPLSVSEGTTVEQAIIDSGILTTFPDIELTNNNIGIFSKKVPLNHTINAGDRIEIYRPLTIDPKTRRRLLAEKK